MAYIPVKVPKITAAIIVPNPANINQKAKISVTVEEETMMLRPCYYFSGDAFCAEEYNPLTVEPMP